MDLLILIHLIFSAGKAMSSIILYKNSEEISYNSNIDVLDRDLIRLRIDCLEELDTEVYVEDYRLPVIFSDEERCFYTKEDRIFRESFGISSIRIFINGDLHKEFLFRVYTNEEKFIQIKNMVMFLLKNNDRILDICLSRTKQKYGSQSVGAPTFETIISTAEDIISFLQDKRFDLKCHLKKRLILHKEEKNEFNYSNIDPFEIINNFDKIYPSEEVDALKIMGKNYSLDSIKRDNYIESYNLEENSIILGGILSIKNLLLDINTQISNHKSLESLSYEKEYAHFKSFEKAYCIDDLYLSITTDGMLKRIERLINSIEQILIELKNKLKIPFKGFIYPKHSFHIKNSSFYRQIFNKLLNWYNLGAPTIGTNDNLIKIRSISKIYELYCLYKLIDVINKNGWVVVNSKEHSNFKNFIPCEVEFKKGDYILELFYDKTINVYSKTYHQHNDLVYLDHYKMSNHKYYTPDFILKISKLESHVRYFIFDAKYSDVSTLAKFNVLDELYRKYHTNLAVFNQEQMSLDHEKIYSIIALNPFGKKRLTKWHPIHGMNIFPIVESCKISHTECDFDNYITYFEF